ncbi:hypothetical protein AVEN_85648-1 [Araneus ventricosus]|uniref:Uncharacterized protein n=1 Tax=Araneus ventricosus TaxID=182803 RepID=A0A4Y2T447_ARAVE|nr:hypothetical protein AVEN_85648-1 [Araneus ventricosus]
MDGLKSGMAWRGTTPFVWSGALVNDCNNAASASRAFTPHQKKDVRPLTDLACTRFVCKMHLWWNWGSNLELRDPEVDYLLPVTC